MVVRCVNGILELAGRVDDSVQQVYTAYDGSNGRKDDHQDDDVSARGGGGGLVAACPTRSLHGSNQHQQLPLRLAEGRITVNSIGRTHSRSNLERHEDEPTPPPQLGRGRLERFIHDGSSSPTYERALLDAVRNAKTPAVGSKPIQATAPRNDDVLLVGTNVDSVATERRVLSTATKTHFVGRDDTGTIQIGGARFGLALQEGEPPSPDSVALRSAFERTLGLPHEKAAAVVAVLTRASPGAREELAAIAVIWAKSEAGGDSAPSRVVLSGHSGGDGIFTGRNDSLTFRSFRELAEALPRAASSVRHVHISGCVTGGQVFTEGPWRKAFPNLETMWGYDATCPASPAHHLQTWEKSTRGKAEAFQSAPFAGVVTWSARDGVRTRGASTEILRVEAAKSDSVYSGWLDGSYPISNPHRQDVQSAYETYRALAARPNASQAERNIANGKADALLRLRYYERSVRLRFATDVDPTAPRRPEDTKPQNNAVLIATAYQRLSIPAADFASLTRQEAIRSVDRFVSTLAPNPKLRQDPIVMFAYRKLVGLKMLSPDTVRAEWAA